MSKATFAFVEATPASASTLVSSASVQGAASYLPKGIAGPLGDYSALLAVFDVPSNTTGGTVSIVLQTSHDEGQTWYDRVALPSIANGAAAVSYSASLSLATSTTVPVAVGKNGSPALAGGTVVGGAFGDRARLVMTGGAGTTSSINIVVRLVAQRPERNR